MGKGMFSTDMEEAAPSTQFGDLFQSHMQQFKMKKRRHILQPSQVQVLEAHFLRNANWDGDEIKRLADMLDTTKTKIYKWNWDRKKKEELKLLETGAQPFPKNRVPRIDRT